MDFIYKNLRPMDGVCTASSNLFGRMIRLWTSRLKNYNGFYELFRMNVANHFGYIVEMGNKYWMAEMLGSGLKINSLKEYLRDTKKNRIVSIVRHSLFDELALRNEANAFVIQKANDLVDYDWKGSPGAFIGICGNGPQNWYCSEMGENVVNKYGNTWDNWQLKREGKKSRIAPIEINYGKNAYPVSDYLKS